MAHYIVPGDVICCIYCEGQIFRSLTTIAPSDLNVGSFPFHLFLPINGQKYDDYGCVHCGVAFMVPGTQAWCLKVQSFSQHSGYSDPKWFPTPPMTVVLNAASPSPKFVKIEKDPYEVAFEECEKWLEKNK